MNGRVSKFENVFRHTVNSSTTAKPTPALTSMQAPKRSVDLDAHMLGLAVFAEGIVDDNADGRNARVRDQVPIAKVAGGGARFCGAPAKRPLGMAQVVD